MITSGGYGYFVGKALVVANEEGRDKEAQDKVRIIYTIYAGFAYTTYYFTV